MSDYGDDEYGDDDFDDYEFEDFGDSEGEDDEEGDEEEIIVDNKALRDTNYSENEVVDTMDEVEVNDHDHDHEGTGFDRSEVDLGSTDAHNQHIIENLRLNEDPSDFARTENSSTVEGVGVGVSGGVDQTPGVDMSVSTVKGVGVGDSTMVQSISTELRQMMLDEEQQNRDNIRSASPVQGPESSKSKSFTGRRKGKKVNDRVKSPVTFSTLLPGEEGLTDNSSSLIEGGTFTNNMSSIEASGISPSKVITGPGSESWKSELDGYSAALIKSVQSEKKRSKGSRFIQSHVSHDAKHHRSIVEKQLRCALQQVNSYRKENAHLTKMIDTSTIQAEFSKLRVQNEEQRAIIRQLNEEKRALLLVQRNQEKSLLDTEKEKEAQPEQEYINKKKMSLFEKKVKSLRDNLYTYQVKAREEAQKNKVLRDQNTKLKVKLKAATIQNSVAEQVRREKLGLSDNQDHAQSCNDKFESLGVGDESTVKQEDTVVVTENKEETIDDIRSQRNRLKSIVDHQRSSFRFQLVVLQSKLEASLLKRKELEDELVRREKEMKNQIFAVKELNKTCEELNKSNMELLKASSLYSKKVRRTVGSEPVVPRPPAQTFTARPSPVMARPKEPMMANDNTFLTGHQFDEED